MSGCALARYRPIKQPHARKGVDRRTMSRHATDDEMELASRAIRDLEVNRNKIVLVPAPEPHFDSHKIRRIESRNPGWYIAFSRPYWKSLRSFQLKRWRVVKALTRVALGWVRGNGYENILLDFLKENHGMLGR
jgi:hypothetical protein